MKHKEITLGDIVKVTDSLGVEFHIQLTEKCRHNWMVVHYIEGDPVERNEEKCNKCQDTRPSDPLNFNRRACGLPLATNR